jgi:hypothetical protein
LFDRAAPEIVTIDVEEIECEVGEAIGPVPTGGGLEQVYMRNAALVGDRYLSVEDDGSAPRGELSEWAAELGASGHGHCGSAA